MPNFFVIIFYELFCFETVRMSNICIYSIRLLNYVPQQSPVAILSHFRMSHRLFERLLSYVRSTALNAAKVVYCFYCLRLFCRNNLEPENIVEGLGQSRLNQFFGLKYTERERERDFFFLTSRRNYQS